MRSADRSARARGEQTLVPPNGKTSVGDRRMLGALTRGETFLVVWLVDDEILRDVVH